MKHIKLIFPALLILFIANTSFAQQINGRFSTSFYSWERFTGVNTSNMITRLYQNLQFDASHEQFSFHTSLTGAIGGASSFSDDGLVRVYNAYLRWKNIGNVLDVNLGRVPVFAGVGIGTVDGLLFKSKLYGEKVVLTGYGGANVSSNLQMNGYKNINKNFFTGGQLIAYLFDGSRIGLSYTNRNRLMKGYTAIRPDSIYDPISVIIQPEVRKEQLVGMDASYYYGSQFSAYGRFDYDINSSHVLRGEVNSRVAVTQKLAFTGTYLYREPRIPYHSFFSIFESESINEIEGGVEYSLCSPVSTFGRVAFVQYGEELSRRLSIGLNSKYCSFRYSGSNGYTGQLVSYNAEAMYPLFDRKFIPTAGASFTIYRLDEKIGNREELFGGSLGVIVRIMSSFSIDTQVQWLKNKIAKDDVRVFGKVSYWFNHNFSKSQITGEGE